MDQAYFNNNREKKLDLLIPTIKVEFSTLEPENPHNHNILNQLIFYGFIRRIKTRQDIENNVTHNMDYEYFYVAKTPKELKAKLFNGLDTFRHNLTYQMFIDTRTSILNLINIMVNDSQIKGLFSEVE